MFICLSNLIFSIGSFPRFFQSQVFLGSLVLPVLQLRPFSSFLVLQLIKYFSFLFPTITPFRLLLLSITPLLFHFFY
ncbi:unnamed protein product [Rhizophagus irregularis]|nr:unnamed protein product [Rhizophagus irregularis]